MIRVTGRRRIAGYEFRGVEDWHCYVQDAGGRWYRFTTEVSRHWLDLPPTVGDDTTAEGVLAVGLLMAAAGEKPIPIEPEFVDDLDRHFGEIKLRGAYQDGADFYVEDPLGHDEDHPRARRIASYPDLVRNDFDIEGARLARRRFAENFPRYVVQP